MVVIRTDSLNNLLQLTFFWKEEWFSSLSLLNQMNESETRKVSHLLKCSTKTARRYLRIFSILIHQLINRKPVNVIKIENEYKNESINILAKEKEYEIFATSTTDLDPTIVFMTVREVETTKMIYTLVISYDDFKNYELSHFKLLLGLDCSRSISMNVYIKAWWKIALLLYPEGNMTLLDFSIGLEFDFIN